MVTVLAKYTDTEGKVPSTVELDHAKRLAWASAPEALKAPEEFRGLPLLLLLLLESFFPHEAAKETRRRRLKRCKIDDRIGSSSKVKCIDSYTSSTVPEVANGFLGAYQ